MDFLGPVLVVGIITLGIYRLVELFARKKERMTIIEKLEGQMKHPEVTVDLNLPIFQKSNSNWALKMSLLLIGIGIGLILAFCIEFVTIESKIYQDYWQFKSALAVVYFACVAVFGGIGLLVAYFIERKEAKK